MEIGDKIKFLRRIKGLNQTQLAEQSKVSLPYINQIEKGKADAVSDTIYEQIAAALGVPLSEIKDSQKGVKIGFQPSIWSVPLLSMLLNKPLVEARMSYTYNTETQDKDFYSLNGKDETRLLSDVNGYEFVGKNSRKHNEDKEVKEKVKKISNIEFVSEGGLITGLVNQEYDIIFAPADNSDSNLSSIASICNTVQGGIYAVVFSNNPEKLGWVNKRETSVKSVLSLFLAQYKDAERWSEFIKNSFFYYQKGSISEYITNEIIGDLFTDSEKRIELDQESVLETVERMMMVLNKNSLDKEKTLKVADLVEINTDGGAFSYGEKILKKVNINSQSNWSKSLNNRNKDSFFVYIGWEPYISGLIERYEKEFEKKYYCLNFNVNQFLSPNTPSFILDYECFIKSDKLESYKKNDDLKKFFLELDSTIKRLNKLSQSKSISPEINTIANFLDLEPKKVVELIRKINFSLKFYPHWCY